eukprot:358609-Chlamydomonas_euryale.AAC.2
MFGLAASLVMFATQVTRGCDVLNGELSMQEADTACANLQNRCVQAPGHVHARAGRQPFFWGGGYLRGLCCEYLLGRRERDRGSSAWLSTIPGSLTQDKPCCLLPAGGTRLPAGAWKYPAAALRSPTACCLLPPKRAFGCAVCSLLLTLLP